MGSKSSTRWHWSYERKTTVESCRVIDARDTLPDVSFIQQEYPHWGFSEGDLSFGLWFGDDRPELVIYQRQREDYIALERTVSQPAQQIIRYWLRCPDCGRRCRILYIPPGSKDLACRKCHDLCYTSQLGGA